MKKLLLFTVFVLLTGIANSAKVVIVNSGFTFSPAEVSIDLGDTVVFTLGDIHNAVEVSETTWNANGSTPLPGFSVPFGGGTVTGLAAGIHYYVCTPHAEGGMKGKITVNASSGIQPDKAFDNHFRLYPNPASNTLILESKTSGNDWDQAALSTLEIVNILGENIYSLESYDMNTTHKIDISAIPAGNYFIRIRNDKDIYTRIFIKDR